METIKTEMPELDLGSSSGSSLSNTDFEAYYSHVFCEADGSVSQQRWTDALQLLRTPQPLVIRPLFGGAADSATIHDEPARSPLASDIASIIAAAESEAKSAKVDPPRFVWLPAWRAWELRRHEHQFQAWHDLSQLLYRAQRTGECTVQELTSNLPVLLLRPNAEDLVADLCAAPGSKTLQALEEAAMSGTANEATGFLIANELNPKRAEALCERMLGGDAGSLSQRCLVSCCNAATFPTLYMCTRLPDGVAAKDSATEEDSRATLANCSESGVTELDRTASAGADVETSGHSTPWYRRCKLKFNKILCDAPCSGDGTMRKSPDIWQTWAAKRGLANFPRQLAILRRALELLQDGGRCIYSTCSLNPVENEAVVAAALRIHNDTKARQGGGSVLLEDGHQLLKERLPGLPAEAFERGLQHWRVPSPEFSAAVPTLYEAWDAVPTALRSRRTTVRASEAQADSAPPQGADVADGTARAGVKLRSEMFPSTDGVDTSRCIRVLPGPLVNGGGFFLAVITKQSDSSSAKLHKDKGSSTLGQLWADCRFAFPRVKRKSREIPALLGFFGLLNDASSAAAAGVERFPLERLAWAPARGGAKKQGGRAGSFTLLGDAALQLQHSGDLEMLGGGLPLFARMDDDCAWARHAGLAGTRQEHHFFTWRPEGSLAAASFLARCCTRRVLRLPRILLRRLLQERRLAATEFLQEVGGLEACGPWGQETVQPVSPEDALLAIVPGGVLVTECQDMALDTFVVSALLSPTELLVLGSADFRTRSLSLLGGTLSGS